MAFKIAWVARRKYRGRFDQVNPRSTGVPAQRAMTCVLS